MRDDTQAGIERPVKFGSLSVLIVIVALGMIFIGVRDGQIGGDFQIRWADCFETCRLTPFILIHWETAVFMVPIVELLRRGK